MTQVDWKGYNLERNLSQIEDIKRRVAIKSMCDFIDRECIVSFSIREHDENEGMHTFELSAGGKVASIGYTVGEGD